jgi:hypothetical protein
VPVAALIVGSFGADHNEVHRANGVKLVVVPLTPGCLGRVGSRRNDPATAIGAPRADTNRGFRVSRSIFDATGHVGAFVVPVAPRERPWFSFGGLQGRLVGSTAVRFFDANGSGRLIPSAARHHPICLGPTPDPKSTAKPTDGIREGSAKSWG